MKKIITLLFMLCSMNLFSQSIYYVKPAGSDNNSGTSWASAFRTVQKALSSISTGQIWVAAGTYFPDETGSANSNDRNASFYLKNDVALYGGFEGTESVLFQRSPQTNVTVLSGEIDGVAGNASNSYHVVRSSSVNNTAILDGFTITAGNASFENGGGMLNTSSSATISNCIFRGNATYEYGAGMYNLGSTLTISKCSFDGNKSDYDGGAMYNAYSSPIIVNCTFIGNSASSGAGIANSNAHPNISNCVFIANVAGFLGGAFYNYYSSHTVTNSSFSRNADHYGGGAFCNVQCSPTLINCILWGNNGSFYDGNQGGQIVSYSIVQGGYPGTGNLNQDPLIVDAANGNFRLMGCSPAIDAGSFSAFSSAVTTDLDGNPRYVPGEIDMGAYEYQPDGTSSIIFVNSTVSGGLYNGTSWANAFTNLPDALQKAASCKNTEIWVTAGTYYPTVNSTDRMASFVLKNNVKLRGGFNGTEVPGDPHIRRYQFTTLSGDIDRDGTLAGNSYHVVRSTDVNNSAVLNGFIITGGNADGEVNLNNDRGGGMYNERSYPTLTECIITGNRALNYGGGIFNSNSDQPPWITNALFTENTSGYAGGAIYNIASSPRILHCTIAGNTAEKGGGVYNISRSYPNIINSILWANGISIDTVLGARPTVSYSIVEGGWTGTGNLSLDPQFVIAGFSLMPGSPAINAGSDAAAVDLITDLANHPRKQGLHVDMGAYEFATVGGGEGPGPTQPLTITCSGDFTVNADSGACGAVVDYFDSHPALVMGGTRPVSVIYVPASPAFLPIGENTVTVTATDSTGESKSCSFIVTILDHVPPEITDVITSPSVLYPPNHKMQEVFVQYRTGDCSPLTTKLSVTSNEPVNGTGNGDTGPDWEIIDEHHVRLRAERSGNGTGRIYTITITATDSSGNIATTSTTVVAPHDYSTEVKGTQRFGKEELINRLKVNAIPNPTSDGFTIVTQSSSWLTLNIQVTDNLGRVVEKRTGVLPNGTIYLGSHYRPGVYFLEIVQGDSVQTLKLLKQAR